MKLMTEHQHSRLMAALEILEDLAENLPDDDDLPLPPAVDQVLMLTGWAYKEAMGMPVAADSFEA